jgi:DNA-binding transcriptional regulator YiaG
MHEWDLKELRRMADMTVEEYAAALEITPEELVEMEAGRKEIPARFSRDAFRATDEAMIRMGY